MYKLLWTTKNKVWLITPASDNEHRYLSLYEENININSDWLRSRLMVEDVYYNFFEDQKLITWGILLK